MKVRGREISFSWLRPPPMPADGNMSLYDHLRELRYRLVVIVLTVVVGMIICAFFYNQLFDLLMRPLLAAQEALKETRPDQEVRATQNDVAAPFLTFMKVTAISALVLTAPVWLHQVWAFIVPGLLAKEKKWARLFVALATPLFIAGVVTAYLVMPKGVEVLLTFTPEGVGVLNLLTIEGFLSLMIRVMLMFGLSYLIPLVLLLLNILGIVKAVHLAKFRPAIIVGSFVFAAIATPTTDPFSMCAMALPLVILMMITEQIARVNDKRKARNEDDPIANDVVLQAMYAEDERKATEKKALTASTDERDAIANAIDGSSSTKS